MTIEPGPSPLTIDTRAGDTGHAVWVSLRGEADVSNHHQLQFALSSIELDGIMTVHLRLAELTFCDTRAFRHLLTFAQDAQASSHAISVHGASSAIRTMTALFGAGEALRVA